MNNISQGVLELLEAYDGSDEDQIDRAWDPLLTEDTTIPAFNLIRAALFFVVDQTVPSDISDENLESLAGAIRDDNVEGAKFGSDAFTATLLMARGDGEVAAQVPDGAWMVLSAVTTAVLSRHGSVDRSELLERAAQLAKRL